LCNINPILTYPAYLAGYIEKLGTGTKDLVEDCEAMGLPTPQFVQEEGFLHHDGPDNGGKWIIQK